MEVATKSGLLSAASLYQSATRLYSEIPYRLFTNGYSLPAWHYYLEITRRCNLRCKMCQYIDWLENVPIREQMEGELSTQEWFDVIDQIPKLSLVTFTGGEVFVRKDFMEIMERASKRLRTHIITNNTMMPEDRIDALIKMAPKRLGGVGFNFAGTSIEGPGERHDEIRKMKGAWERSMNGIRDLKERRDAAGKACPMIHVTTVIQKDNLDVMHLMPKLIADAGADVLNLVTETRMLDLPGVGEVDPASFTEDDLDYPRLDRKELEDALNATHAEAVKHGVEIRMPRMSKEELIKYYTTGIELKDYECRNAWNTITIGRQGDMYSCWIKRAGNVRDASLKEIWNNGTMKEFRQSCQGGVFALCPGCCFLEHKSQREYA